jgi:hypothetical protein
MRLQEVRAKTSAGFSGLSAVDILVRGRRRTRPPEMTSLGPREWMLILVSLFDAHRTAKQRNSVLAGGLFPEGSGSLNAKV